MEKLTSENKKLLTIALGGVALGFGISRYRGAIMMAVVAYAAYKMKNLHLKEFINGLSESRFTKAEVNKIAIDDNDDSGGYRTGLPAS